jgi:alpha-glucosidase (family GH31 glycosyl hydrolase)
MFFQTSNGLTFSYNQNSNLTFFITGGIVKMKLFVGDYPSDVVEMYHNYLGNYKVPPFWATGYHQSKSGYSDSNILVDVWENFVNHSIPI